MVLDDLIFLVSGANKLSATAEENPCNKDTGSLTQLRGHSRGILPMITGGGHIAAWCHLFKSESPSQVAIFIIAFFCTLLQDVPVDVRKKKRFFLSYDNICNLSRMHLWREPLLFKSFANLWTENLVKIIDNLHLHNHVRKSCHTDFNPKILKAELPHANTMICEQAETYEFWLKSRVLSMS